jgi:uncharacterized repeat protein (TIGR03803 family)
MKGKTKICVKTQSPFALRLPAPALAWALAGQLSAQTFTALYSFSPLDYATGANDDGASPYAGLVSSGSSLYGTTTGGGSGASGTVFKINADGTGFVNLHSFTALSPSGHSNSDGSGPHARLVLAGNTLYGTAQGGGSSGNGTVFALNTDGSGFVVLHSFAGRSGPAATNWDGAAPVGAVILSGSTLYGTASGGGVSGSGTVFALNSDGTGFRVLHSFGGKSANGTNSEGANPASLVLSNNALYGAASHGGSSGSGTLFKLNTDGTGFETLHTFTAAPFTAAANSYTNSDGAWPLAALVLSGNTLYGTTTVGSTWGHGTVFKVSTDGTGFTSLYSFSAGQGLSPPAEVTDLYNVDGAYPRADLILSGNTLYGTTPRGGTGATGTVFGLNTDGTGFTTLYNFTGGSFSSPPFGPNCDGAIPSAGLTFLGNTLYGTASDGGDSADGTVFTISLPATPPHLTIMGSGANVILTWPTNAIGFTVQSTTNLGLAAVWTTVSPGSVVVNGQNTVTNPMLGGTQQFYRLAQ